MKYTSGPWEIVITPSGHQYIEHWPTGKRTDEKIFVAQANMLSPETPNAKADARLIAAAPELLEACKTALKCGERYDWSFYELMEEAVKRAEGK